MRFVGLLALLLSPFALPAAAETHLLLKLTSYRDAQPIDVVALYGSEIDPNKRSIDDTFRLEINGKRQRVPASVLSELAYKRRAFSYDHFTKGIYDHTHPATCRMGGPALGEVLEVRYLIWEEHQIAESEMRPILSQAANCLFSRELRPNNRHAQLAATRAMAILATIRDLKR